MSVRRKLRQLNYRPYHPHLVHALSDSNQDMWVAFCEQFLQMVGHGKLDIDHILWSNEAVFKLNGCINCHNCVYQAPEKLKVTIDANINLTSICV